MNPPFPRIFFAVGAIAIVSDYALFCWFILEGWTWPAISMVVLALIVAAFLRQGADLNRRWREQRGLET